MSYNELVEFDWSEVKNTLNIRKHGVSFSEATLIWDDELCLQILDPDHPPHEERWIRIGRAKTTNILVVVYCEIAQGNIARIISARKANRMETRLYYTRL